jgi:uncharacterized RDD family membrane protein YckC
MILFVGLLVVLTLVSPKVEFYEPESGRRQEAGKFSFFILWALAFVLFAALLTCFTCAIYHGISQERTSELRFEE